MKIFERGSEWRRWDLHLHTASSYDYEYKAEDCDEILSQKLKENNIAAVAITDHFVIRFLYKGIIIKHNKTEPTYTKTSLFLCEKRRFFMARTEKGVVATI